MISKDNGRIGLITPYTILKNQYYVEARKYILVNSNISVIVDFNDYKVFKDAAVDSVIVILEKLSH
ncbi:MAG: Eco57I restriction-modification methylase domain-containing protein [Saprospiraceae bacterium]|nr:Eco57I restriction-modification methylase domain-containing protein [Saprospiraceae bacterium]